ncbi:glycosyltransferase family 4 protein [Sulfuricurvum sp.]|uniref:MraY family glycosyltransferase n=1 Tax=Sulfuricurvum sp. TaxID=2025608 RepID=UPI00286D9769|nr:glycosyltransferase family 4 protein [Sulfuricurvum sp.]
MINIFLLCCGVFLLSALLTWAIKYYAIRQAILDHPNERSSHTLPTPRGGGLAIVITFYIGAGLLYSKGLLDPKLFYAFCSAFPLLVVSLLDDLYTLGSKIRLIAQLLSSILALYALGGISTISLSFIELSGWWLAFPIVLAMIWLINLYNFLDGIDGYAGSEAIFLGFAVAILFGYDIGYLIVLSVLGFLLFNWQKAKIFMGDIGSTFLGFIFAVLLLDSLNHHIPLYSWLILLGLFWVDATLTLIRRAKKHEKLSQAHRKHAYQRITQAGWSHQKTVLIGMGINIIGTIPLFWLLSSPYELPYSVIYILGLYLVIRLIDKRTPFS